MIQRMLILKQYLKPGKTLILLGPRRVGKTTLMNSFLQKSPKKILTYDGTSVDTQELFSTPSLEKLKQIVGQADILAIDEAQNIKNIGQSLKLINDHLPDTAVIATGSSAFEINGQVGEPLVGRKTTCYLFPFSVEEILNSQKTANPELTLKYLLDNLLVFGTYPDVINNADRKTRRFFLRELVDSLLLKDILAYQEVKSSQVLLDLLKLLAFQVGGEVSLSELGGNLGIDKKTVGRYLDLLEKTYIIFQLRGYSRNLRKEISKKAKYFFYDLGVRNAIINNFNNLNTRDDVGRLWENFCLAERMKARNYKQIYANQYFWRTWRGQEIDLLEEKDGKIFAYEMKWNSQKARNKPPTEWLAEYGESNFTVITPENVLDFLVKN
ncbi:putative AAA family ATPase [Candidatus Termititenax aidoneus]|uniref:AAA family ATPase n=1 Tax=Termititenax aidoneus TaxID=2218524 RepID=A0A388T6Z5_TERA1|nr:putative AAA family ATPase [Candidatus Termititenax aidoneus]